MTISNRIAPAQADSITVSHDEYENWSLARPNDKT